MANEPFISVRKYMKWGDDPAGEDTDTLVLTSSKKYFVDIRIFLDPSNPISSSSSHNPILPISRLQWGFAGTATSTPASIADRRPAHTKWKHWIDSKTTDEVEDEGDMYPQPNGEVLEKGAMLNENKNKIETYEEVWADLDVERGERSSWVLTCEVDGEGVRGMVIRIGGYVQGVLRRGEEVSVGRWTGKGGKWVLVGGVGKLDVPKEVLEGREFMEGEVVGSSDGLKWTCVEGLKGW